MRHVEVCATLALALGTLCSCSSGSGSLSQIDTGLNESQLLNSVSSDEAKQVCEAVERALETRLNPEAMLAAACQLLGAVSTSTQADCQRMADTCTEQGQQGDGQFNREDFEQDFACETDGIESQLAACNATVGEFERCFGDQITAATQALDQFSCADATTLSQQSLAELQEEPQLPASCQTLSSQCPIVDL